MYCTLYSIYAHSIGYAPEWRPSCVQGGADTCTGDGGGPLLCPLASEPGRLIQVLYCIIRMYIYALNHVMPFQLLSKVMLMHLVI